MAARLLWMGGHAQAGWKLPSSTMHEMHGGDAPWECMLLVLLCPFQVAEVAAICPPEVLKVTIGEKKKKKSSVCPMNTVFIYSS